MLILLLIWLDSSPPFHICFLGFASCLTETRFSRNQKLFWGGKIGFFFPPDLKH